MSGNLIVYAAPLPFSNKQVRRVIPHGLNLRQIVNTLRPESDAFAAIVMIDGERVPMSMWANIRPKPGAANIVINIVPQGGGKKNPLATLLSIAVLIAAPYASTAILGPTLASTTILGSVTYGTLLSGAIGMVGRLLISAIAPPPRPSNLGNGAASNAAESPTLFIEGARNRFNPYGVVPICLGTNRVFPDQCARLFTETVNDDQYVRQLFTWGFGKLALKEFKIGETLLTEFNDVQMEHRLEGDLNEGVDLFPNDPFQDDYSVLLQQVDGFTTRTTQPNADEAIVDITFNQGLSRFTAEGRRVSQVVQLEIQYALNGVSPQVWSAPAGSFKSVVGATFTPGRVVETVNFGFGSFFNGFRKDIISVDKLSGQVIYTEGSGAFSSAASCDIPTTPENQIRIATITVNTQRTFVSPTNTTTFTITDDRSASLFGTVFQNSTDFAPSPSGATVVVAAGNIAADPLRITGAQTEALRRSTYLKFPTRGQYDIRVRRISADTSSDQIFDKATLTAIRSFTYRNPVNKAGISGTAVRMRGTEQLNGPLDQLNAIASLILPDYDAGTDTWIERISSNPASLYRLVLQNYGGSDALANAKPLEDAKIDIDTLIEWHALCVAKNYTYNRVIDYETSVDDVLRDIAAAGAASPDIRDNKRTVVIDCPKDEIKQVITPRNSWGYSGQIIYPDQPHALRVNFRNASKGYSMDERIVYDDGYSELGEVPGTIAATKFESLELVSCTNAELAFITGRRHIASGRLRPETHTFNQDVENLVAVRGDRITLAHDAPIIGVGDGRIKTITLNADSPQLVTGFTIDDTITIPTSGDYYVRIRTATGVMLYKELITSVGSSTSFNFTTPFLASDAPGAGDLCYIVEAGAELDLIITKIEPQADLTARITAVDYAPAVFTAESATIPPFNSNITPPLSLLRPLSPVLLGEPQSNESVMTRNSDGSFTSRMVINLQNDNEGEIETEVSIRTSGTDSFARANVLESSPTRVVLTGLQDGVAYDVHVRYRRRGSSMMSLPLQINGYTFIGATTVPDDVTGFVVSIAEGLASFKWEANDDIDISHYKIKFARLFTGATWASAQVLEDNLQNNRLTTTFQGGTYLIKAVDILGNESANATLIVTYDEGSLRNVVETLVEDPDFLGVKDNVATDGSTLVMADTSLDGYYYFTDTVDLGEVFTSYLTAAILANGAFVNDLFDIDDLFGESDLFGQDGGDLFEITDLFAESDLFGIGEGAWAVVLQYRTTNMDSGASPVIWSDWQEFNAGNVEFRAIQFRVVLQSFSPAVSPRITGLSVTIDMPDRVEADSDLVSGGSGLRVDFDPAFKDLDGLAIVAQDMLTGDYYEVTNKDHTGFDIIFRNAAGTPVTRTFDYVAKGYGRVTP